MSPLEIIQLFNIIAPSVFVILDGAQKADPSKSYKEVLEEAGVRLDAQAIRLLADMSQAVTEGAIPNKQT